MKTILMIWEAVNGALLGAATAVLAASTISVSKGGPELLTLPWQLGLLAFVGFGNKLADGLKQVEASLADKVSAGVAPALGKVGLAMAAGMMMFLAGCMSPVPSNHFTATVGGEKFDFETRKQTAAEGLEYSHTVMDASGKTNVFSLKVNKLSSTNDPQVIDRAYAGQAAVIDAQGRFLKSMVDAAEALGQKGGEAVATGGVVH